MSNDEGWKKLQAAAKGSGAWWIHQDEEGPVDDIDLEVLFGDAQTVIAQFGYDSPIGKTVSALARVVLSQSLRLNAALASVPVPTNTKELIAEQVNEYVARAAGYQFTRDDTIAMLRREAEFVIIAALNSDARGARKMVLSPETARKLAEVTIAALSSLAPTDNEVDE